MPFSSWTRAATVGFPRESSTSSAPIERIFICWWSPVEWVVTPAALLFPRWFNAAIPPVFRD